MALGQPLTKPYYYRYCKQWKCETNKLVKRYKSVISFEQNYQVKAVLNSKNPELYKKKLSSSEMLQNIYKPEI